MCRRRPRRRIPSVFRNVPYRALLLCPTNLASWCAYFGAYFGLALVLSVVHPLSRKGSRFRPSYRRRVNDAALCGWLRCRHRRQLDVARAHARGLEQSDRPRRRVRRFICFGAFALIVAPYASNIPLRIALIVMGTSLPSVVYVLSPAILGEIVPDAQRGAVLAINSAIGTSAGIFAPYIMGTVVDGAASAAQGYSNGFVICGLVTLAGGLIGLAFLHPERECAAQAARLTSQTIVVPA